MAALLIHPWSGHGVSQPISFELRDGNPFAFLTLVGLGWLLLALGARFRRAGSLVSAAACALCVGLLVVIPATDPRSAAHLAAYAALVAIAMGLFLVWSMDTFDLFQVLPPFLPVALGLPFYWSLGIGAFQLLLIGSLLVALNLTFRHLGDRVGA